MALTKVTAGLITANAVVDSFGTQSITGDKIGLTAINANNIVNASITGDKIGVGQITANLFAAGAVSATSISDGTSNVSVTSTNGNVIVGTAGSERVRFSTGGDVGIGTSNPTARLDVRRSTTEGSIAEFHQSSGYGIDISSSEAIANISSGYLQSLAFRTDPSSGPVERMRITSAGLLQFNSGYGSVATAYGCRAWVNFNGENTPTIRNSGNVSSITDLGIGTYRLNFATAMPDSDYSAAGATDRVPDGIVVVDTYNTSNVRILSTNGGGGFEDTPTICVVIFR